MAGKGTEETVGLTEEKEKRVVKPTLRALEHNLQMKISSRRAILGQLTEKKNELYALMDDDVNAENIEKELLTKYEELLKDFSEINEQVKDLFCQAGCEENMNTDQRDWFEPRNTEVARLFAPYNVNGGARSNMTRRPAQVQVSRRSYTHTVCCLADHKVDKVPSVLLKADLLTSGLGEQKVTFSGNDNECFRSSKKGEALNF
ncbi:hypothetical protein ABVT39_014047 [Epinephelus coioides]